MNGGEIAGADIAGWTLAGLLGLVAGSFASAISHRLPRRQNFVTDHSRCPHCGHPLGPADLVPVVSWIALGRRCRYCGTPISWRYPAIELLTMLLFLAAWWRAGGDYTDAGLLALLALGLMIIMVTDLETRIIPDAMLLALLPVAVAWQWRHGGHWLDAGLGLVVGPAVILPARALFKALRGRQGLGLGDVKFIALAGLVTGFAGLPTFLILGGVLGLGFGVAWRVAGRGAVFPFGPCLAIALLLCLLLPGAPGMPPAPG